MNREGKKCVLYVRVSTAMQVDGYSLDGQKNMLKQFAEREGMEIINIYEDAGKSGKSIEGRPAFQQMILDIQNGLSINYVIVYKLSRFGRNAADVLNSLEELQTYDVNLISLEEGIDSSQTTGKLLISLLSAISEIERENIIEQTMNGRREKARQGGWNGGFAPYGYDLVNGELIVSEDEAEAIKLIFDMYTKNGFGIEKIAKEMNLRGIKKKPRQNGYLDIWTRTLIRNIVDNPIYAGKLAYGRRSKEKIKGTKNEYHMVSQKEFILTEGNQDAIIDEETWNIAYSKRMKTKGVKKSLIGRDRIHYLSGILRCPKCGGPMYASKYYNKSKKGIYKEYYFYECSHHKSHRGYRCDCNIKITKPKIEPYVIEFLKRIINNEEFIRLVSNHINQKTDSITLEKEKKLFEDKLKETLDNKSRIERSLDNMPLTEKHRERKIEDLNKRLDDLYDIINELEIKINSLTVKIASAELGKITRNKIFDVLSNFDKLYEVMDDEEKKKAITGIISSINTYEVPIGNNYIKSIHFKFNINDKEHMEFEISGDMLNDIEDLSLDYQENTYLEMPTDKEYKKHENKKSYYVKKNKVTYKMIQDYVMENYGYKVHTCYIAEVKRKNCIDMQADRQTREIKYPCPQEKVIAIEDALKHFKMI